MNDTNERGEFIMDMEKFRMLATEGTFKGGKMHGYFIQEKEKMPASVAEFMKEKKLETMWVSEKESKLLEKAKDAKFVETILKGDKYRIFGG